MSARPLVAGRIAIIAFAVLAPYVVTNAYGFHLLIMAVIWGILATSLNVVLGYAGLLSIGHGALFGIGAYTSSLLVLKGGFGFWPALVAAVAVAAAVGCALGVLTLRTRGHYFAISTLSFGIATSLVIEKWEALTEGPRGLMSIPAPDAIPIFGLATLSFRTNAAKYYLAAAVLALCLLVVSRLVRSPFGAALEAIRQNELVADCLGVDPVRHKLLAFSISAGMAGAAGALYAVYITYLSPADSGFWIGFYAVLYVVVGGMGTLWGPLLGALALVTLPELLREFEEFRLFLFGVLLIVMIRFLPRGLAGALVIARARLSRKGAAS